MATLAEIRAQYPQYNDMSDQQLADAMYQKFYADMPRSDFNAKLGIVEQAAPSVAKGLPTSANEFLHDSVSGVAQGASFNLADELYGGFQTPIRMAVNAISGEDAGKSLGQRISDAYARGRDFARGDYKQAQERSPVATTVGEIGGGVTLGGKLQEGGATLLNAAKPTYGSMIGRGALEGAGYGAAYGFGGGEGIEDRIGQAVTGGAIGGLTGGAMGAVGARMAQRAANESIPSADVLGKQASAAYQAVDQSGIALNPKSFDKMVDDIAAMAKGERLNSTLHPDSTGVLEILNASKGQSPTLSEVDQLRQIIGDAASSPKPGDRRIASKMIDALDNYVNGLKPGDIVGGGDPLNAVSALNTARQTYAMRQKAQLVADAFNKADLRAASTGSGGNLDNAIRQNLRSLLQSPKSRGFSQEERDMIEQIVRGSKTQNLARWIGKLSPEGNGLMAMLHAIGGYSSGGATIPLAAVGFGAKRFADNATPRNVEALSRVIRSGGQLPQVQMLPAQQRALLEGLLVTGAQQGSQIQGLLGNSP